MGSISRFDISAICARFGCEFLVETGTGAGNGLEFARSAPFKGIFSIEIHSKLAEAARQRFASDSRIEIINGKSIGELGRVLSRLPHKSPILFLVGCSLSRGGLWVSNLRRSERMLA